MNSWQDIDEDVLDLAPREAANLYRWLAPHLKA